MIAAYQPGRVFSSANQPDAWNHRSRPGGTVGIKCPHCREPVKIRSSRVWTLLFKELTLQCSNVYCGATYIGSLTIDRGIVPSAMPNPKVRLPMGRASSAPPANDDGPAPPTA